MSIADTIGSFIQWLLGLFGSDDRVKKIQELVVVGCGFLPTATSVAGILAAPNPAVTGIIAVAVAICHAVKSPPIQGLADLGVYGEVNGVPIEGTFVPTDEVKK